MTQSRPMRGFALAAVLMAVAACGKKPSIEKNRTVPGAADAVITDPPSGGGGSLSLGTPGLPAYCKEIVDPDSSVDDLMSTLQDFISPGKTRKACFQCQPDRLVRIKCMEIAKGLLEDSCGYNSVAGHHVISCKSESAPGKFDLSPTRVEKILPVLPVMALLFGPAVMEKFPVDSKPREHLIARKGIEFAAGFLGPVILGEKKDEAAAAISEIATGIRGLDSPGQPLSDAQKLDIHNTAKAVLSVLSTAAQRQDSMTPAFLSSAVDPLLQKVPELAPLKVALPVLFSELSPPELLAIIMQALPQEKITEFSGMLDGFNAASGSGSSNP